MSEKYIKCYPRDTALKNASPGEGINHTSAAVKSLCFVWIMSANDYCSTMNSLSRVVITWHSQDHGEFENLEAKNVWSSQLIQLFWYVVRNTVTFLPGIVGIYILKHTQYAPFYLINYVNRKGRKNVKLRFALSVHKKGTL